MCPFRGGQFGGSCPPFALSFARSIDKGIANANTVIKTTIVSHHAGDRDADTDSPHAAQETSRYGSRRRRREFLTIR